MINAIAAVGKRGQIGLGGKIPWIPAPFPALEKAIQEDLAWFARMTAGGVLVVGKNTYREMLNLGFQPRSRDLHVWSRGRGVSPTNWLADLYDRELDGGNREIWVCGGGKVFEIFAPQIHRWHISKIDYDGEADTWLKSFL